MSDERFLDAESEYRTESTSFKEIVMRHVERITRLSAVETERGGHYEERPTKMGMIQIWVPDGKDVYCNAVRALGDLVYGYFDDKITKQEKEIMDAIESRFVKSSVVVNEGWGDGFSIRSYKGDRGDQTYSTAQKQFRYYQHTNLFRALCAFLHRKKFLEVGSIEE